jgi:hypothetical protein
LGFWPQGAGLAMIQINRRAVAAAAALAVG